MSQLNRLILSNQLYIFGMHKLHTLSCLTVRNFSTKSVPKTKRLYNKLKYSDYFISKKHQNKSTKSKLLSSEDVPLIVKLYVQQNSCKTNENIRDNNLANLSKEDLKTQLLEIKHDFRANALNAEKIPDEQLAYVEDTINSKKSHRDFIETIFLDEESEYAAATENSKRLLGTPLPGTGFSDIPCPGCGAKLHCEDPSLPGYMQGEKFTAYTTDKLRESICQRCHLIQHYNLCLDVNVNAQEYADIISAIKTTNPLVILMVDLLDIENSIFPNLLKLVGKNKKIFIVGNKIDLIPKDSPGYLERVKNILLQACHNAGLGDNIKHVALISAKTGYGLEELITKLLIIYGIKGDVYLLGSTNTGKSTLFNTLLQSDYCKSTVRDLIHRATTSIWSGTTLNLLKFPIVNPEPWRLHKRTQRLLKMRNEEVEERRIQRMSAVTDKKKYSDSILSTNILTTDFKADLSDEQDSEMMGQEVVSFERTKSGDMIIQSQQLDETKGKPSYGDFENHFQNVRWLYDTPGIRKSEQIVNILKADEVKRILPKKRLIPRVFMLHPGEVMFISGLSRLDYTKGKNLIYITVFTDLLIPVVIRKSQDADVYYNKYVGGHKLMVPVDNMDHLPSLIGREIELIGCGTRSSTADIQLSSLGWISVAIQRDEVVQLRAYTPGGHGCLLRTTPILPYYKTFQGTRIKQTNSFHVTHSSILK